eukprot:124382_1
MPLLVGDKPIKYETNVIQSLTDNIDWQKAQLSLFEASILKNKNNLSQSSLIILQGECGSINLTKFECIATPFATTCNIAFMTNINETKIMCSHLDEGVDKKQLINVFKLFDKTELQKEGINLYLIGGYLDEKQKSIKVTDKLFTLICNDKKFKNYNINLRLLITSKLNTDYKMIQDEENKSENKKVAIPKYQNVSYNLRTKTFSCFDIKSKNIPYNTLRGAVMFDSSNKNSIRVIYNCCNKKDILNGPKVDAFKWKCPDWIYNVLSYNLSDAKILKFFSTSPYAEHEEFAKDSKALFQFVAYKKAKDVFNGNKPLYMKCGIILNKNKVKKKNDNDKNDKCKQEEKSNKQ